MTDAKQWLADVRKREGVKVQAGGVRNGNLATALDVIEAVIDTCNANLHFNVSRHILEDINSKIVEATK